MAERIVTLRLNVTTLGEFMREHRGTVYIATKVGGVFIICGGEEFWEIVDELDYYLERNGRVNAEKQDKYRKVPTDFSYQRLTERVIRDFYVTEKYKRKVVVVDGSEHGSMWFKSEFDAWLERQRKGDAWQTNL